jgi:hypothetical protein
MGKKPQGPYGGKSLVFSTRITPDLRAKLGEAAAEKGYSLSQEIEERLRDSFILEQKNSEIFGSEQNYLMMRTVALAMQSIKVDWLADSMAFDIVLKRIISILEPIRPPSEGKKYPKQAALADWDSQRMAATLWTSIQEADPAAPISKGSRRDHLLGLLKRRLGPIAERARPDFLTIDDLRNLFHQTIDVTPGDLNKKIADHQAVDELFGSEIHPEPTPKRRKAKK